ncbi:MAG: sulfotransferase [Pseudomonadota bacterium]|nr:sulfotransferase [Pseudomonadota bacterium]
MIIWYSSAFFFGLIFAWLISFLFPLIVKGGSTAKLLAVLQNGVKELLVGQAENFWPAYKAIIINLSVYITRQIGGLILAFAPLIVAVLFLGPKFIALWEEDKQLAVFPLDFGEIKTNDGIKELVLSTGEKIKLPLGSGNIAYCSRNTIFCLTLQSMGFKTFVRPEFVKKEARPIIIRATNDDWNPFWPYLNDPEFIFFLTLSIGSIGFVFKNRKPRYRPIVSNQMKIGFIDNLLTEFSVNHSALIKKIGDFETKILQSKLSQIKVDRPVFISGLARSGTTILLERLSSLSTVGTHRYRDFPFIMSPVLWNHYIKIAGKKKVLSERPHKDGIKITRESPEAFEEPIWQHFFPNIHNPKELHELSSVISCQSFEAFYKDHIKKILWLRKGKRYVSKGNYNLLRINYIKEIFPSALFVIPVRNPLGHVQSLMRQQELFLNYAKDDPNSAKYLKAVGHFEFGEQRQPINIVKGCAEKTTEAWSRGMEHIGYAIQWAEIYGYIARLLQQFPEIAEHIYILRFEDLCSSPEKTFRELLAFTGLDLLDQSAKLADGIHQPNNKLKLSEKEISDCKKITAATAMLFGYKGERLETEEFDQSKLIKRN